MSIADLEPDVIAAELLAPADAGRQIAARVDEARRDVVRTRRLTRFMLAAACGLALAAVWTLFDYQFELSWNARALGLVAIVAATVVIARRGLPQWTGAYRLEDAASDLERRVTQLGQRLRTTLDYQRAEVRPARAAPALVRALEDDTFVLSRDTDFSIVVDSRPILIGVGIVGAMGVAWLIGLAANSEWRTATGRTMLLPWQYTTVTFSPAETTIKAGENVAVFAEVTGRPVFATIVRYRPAGESGEWNELELASDVGAEQETAPSAATDTAASAARTNAGAGARQIPLLGKLSTTIADCQQDLEFEVVAGPVPLARGHVRVLQPLTIDQFHATATPPEYVSQPAEQFERWTFKVLEGSNVAFDVQLNRAAGEARLTPINAKGATAESAESDPNKISLSLVVDGSTLHGNLNDLRANGLWELTAKSDDGIELEPQRLAIRVQPDGRAKIRFLEPSEELEVIPTAEVSFVVEASDDLALVRVGVAAQVADGLLETVWQQEFGAGTTDTIRGETTLRLEDFHLNFQHGVTYYAFADDNYFGTERRTATPLRFIDIRPFKQAYQLLDTGDS